MIFDYLDSNNKGYISYEDFTMMSPERRLSMDPAADIIKEFKEKGELSYKFGKKQARSPSRTQAERVKDPMLNSKTNETLSMAAASVNTQEKSEI